MSTTSSLSIPKSPTSRDLLATSLTGAVVFPAVLGLGQLLVFKPLRLTHSTPLASVCGCISVLAAGCAASVASVKAISVSSRWKSVLDNPKTSRVEDDDGDSIEFGARELLVSTLASGVMFRAFGGRFASVLPSHLLQPGAFAREWIPVRATQATERQRHIIRELGRRHGCHSCGTRSVKQFHADHQPPTKITNNNGAPPPTDNGGTGIQRLYPQCNRCSSLQGGILSHANGPRNKWSTIRTHPLSLRSYHIFLPLPLAIAFLKKSRASMELKSNTVSAEVASSLSISQKEESKKEEKEEKKSKKVEEKDKRVSEAVVQHPQTPLHLLFGDSNLVRDFPLLIIWNRIVFFLDSFHSASDAFHITFLAFTAIAALGTI